HSPARAARAAGAHQVASGKRMKLPSVRPSADVPDAREAPQAAAPWKGTRRAARSQVAGVLREVRLEEFIDHGRRHALTIQLYQPIPTRPIEVPTLLIERVSEPTQTRAPEAVGTVQDIKSRPLSVRVLG